VPVRVVQATPCRYGRTHGELGGLYGGSRGRALRVWRLLWIRVLEGPFSSRVQNSLFACCGHSAWRGGPGMCRGA
jgi:hypothetical protein